MVGELLILFVRLYQRTISPLLGPRCRFHPSCSNYMIEAIRKKGVFIGVPKGLWRIAKCQPFHPGGYDPVEPDPVTPAPPAGGPEGRSE